MKTDENVMSERDIENAFENACYGELIEHAEAFKETDALEEILQLMAPSHVRKISRNSTKKLSELVGVVTSAAFDDIRNAEKSSSVPDPIMYNGEVKKILASSFDWLDDRVNRFEEKLASFSGRLRQWKDEIGDEPFAAGVVVGTIAGIFAGPLGALAGGFVGSMFSDDSVKDEFEREFRFLLQDYADLVEEIRETLNDNLRLSVNCMEKYIKKIEAVNHEPINLLPG